MTYERQLVAQISDKLHLHIEQYIKLHLQPKPRWLPYRVWFWLLGKLLVLEMGDLKVERER